MTAPDLRGYRNTRGLDLRGRKRDKVNRDGGVKDKAVWIVDPVRTAIMSVAAEHFVHVRFGVPWRLDWRKARGDGDVTLPDGRRADAKWRERHGTDLIKFIGSRSSAAVYILVTGRDPDDLTVDGWATAAEMTAETRMLRVETYVVDRDRLRPMADLRGYDPSRMPDLGHVHAWARTGRVEKVPGAGAVNSFVCVGCSEPFIWTSAVAAEYLRAWEVQGGG